MCECVTLILKCVLSDLCVSSITSPNLRLHIRNTDLCVHAPVLQTCDLNRCVVLCLGADLCVPSVSPPSSYLQTPSYLSDGLNFTHWVKKRKIPIPCASPSTQPSPLLIRTSSSTPFLYNPKNNYLRARIARTAAHLQLCRDETKECRWGKTPRREPGGSARRSSRLYFTLLSCLPVILFCLLFISACLRLSNSRLVSRRLVSFFSGSFSPVSLISPPLGPISLPQLFFGGAWQEKARRIKTLHFLIPLQEVGLSQGRWSKQVNKHWSQISLQHRRGRVCRSIGLKWSKSLF